MQRAAAEASQACSLGEEPAAEEAGGLGLVVVGWTVVVRAILDELEMPFVGFGRVGWVVGAPEAVDAVLKLGAAD